MSSSPSQRRRGWLWRVLVSLVLFVALAASVEIVCRYALRPSAGATRFIFLQQMSLERWDYLLAQEHQDMLDSIATERMPTRENNRTSSEEPEGDRPPYDRIRTTYEVTTNADGFRDKPFGPKAPGTRRIVILGDSISYGKGVSVAERYGDRLAKKAPPGVEVLNLAYPACGSACEVSYFEEFKGLQPDLIVYQPSGNDADIAMGQKARATGAGLPSAPARFLLRSRAVQLLAYSMFGDSQAAQMDVAVAAAAEKYGPVLDGFFQGAKARGIRVAVLAFPGSSGDVYGKHVIDACKKYPETCIGSVVVDLAKTPPPSEEPPPWIIETAALFGLPTDGLQALFPFASYFFDIVHPNATAHQAAADQLTELLTAKWDGWYVPVAAPVRGP